MPEHFRITESTVVQGILRCGSNDVSLGIANSQRHIVFRKNYILIVIFLLFCEFMDVTVTVNIDPVISKIRFHPVDTVCGVGDSLTLGTTTGHACRSAGHSPDSHKTTLSVFEESGCVVLVVNCTAGEMPAGSIFGWEQCCIECIRDIQLSPVDKILGHCMPPAHGTMIYSIGIILEEQVPFPVVVDHAVRVIGPAFFIGEVILFAVCFLLLLFVDSRSFCLCIRCRGCGCCGFGFLHGGFRCRSSCIRRHCVHSCIRFSDWSRFRGCSRCLLSFFRCFFLLLIFGLSVFSRNLFFCRSRGFAFLTVIRFCFFRNCDFRRTFNRFTDGTIGNDRFYGSRLLDDRSQVDIVVCKNDCTCTGKYHHGRSGNRHGFDQIRFRVVFFFHDFQKPSCLEISKGIKDLWGRKESYNLQYQFTPLLQSFSSKFVSDYICHMVNASERILSIKIHVLKRNS